MPRRRGAGGVQRDVGTTPMGLTYFKRYRMERDLSVPLFDAPPLVGEYELCGWQPELLEAHAETKYRSFCFEIDANVFPCLGDREGCFRLMSEIARRETFIAGATWLVSYRGGEFPEYCGTIQGIQERVDGGAVQNLGITPAHRGRGLGTLLLRAALQGFREAGLEKAFLEVTAQNLGAVRLYERLGFHTVKTVYKAAEVAYA